MVLLLWSLLLLLVLVPQAAMRRVVNNSIIRRVQHWLAGIMTWILITNVVDTLIRANTISQGMFWLAVFMLYPVANVPFFGALGFCVYHRI